MGMAVAVLAMILVLPSPWPPTPQTPMDPLPDPRRLLLTHLFTSLYSQFLLLHSVTPTDSC